MKGAVKKNIDVLGLGCAAVDDVIYVESFPAPDSKARVQRRLRRYGGLTGNALTAAARLGASCAYAGCLGTDDFSAAVDQNFRREGIDTSHAPRLPEAGVIHSTVVIGQDTGSRNVFYQVNSMVGAHALLPGDEVIRESRVLFIDQYGMEGNWRAMEKAAEFKVPVVADFEDETASPFEEVLRAVDHLILAQDFACRITGESKPANAARALARGQGRTVIVTCGRNGCWSVAQEDGPRPRRHRTFAVRAVNTNGCGDVFHGAYAFRLACGDPLEKRIRFASAAAAVKAQQTEIPHLRAVKLMLRKNL